MNPMQWLELAKQYEVLANKLADKLFTEKLSTEDRILLEQQVTRATEFMMWFQEKSKENA